MEGIRPSQDGKCCRRAQRIFNPECGIATLFRLPGSSMVEKARKLPMTPVTSCEQPKNNSSIFISVRGVHFRVLDVLRVNHRKVCTIRCLFCLNCFSFRQRFTLAADDRKSGQRAVRSGLSLLRSRKSCQNSDQNVDGYGLAIAEGGHKLPAAEGGTRRLVHRREQPAIHLDVGDAARFIHHAL